MLHRVRVVWASGWEARPALALLLVVVLVGALATGGAAAGSRSPGRDARAAARSLDARPGVHRLTHRMGRAAAGLRVAGCLREIRAELGRIERARRRGRPGARSGRRLAAACDGAALPIPSTPAASSPSSSPSEPGTVGEPLASVLRACAFARDDAGRARGRALARCVRRVQVARLAASGVGPPLPAPNVIVILADDQRWDTVDAVHGPDPALGLPAMPATYTRMAGEGITFTEAIVSTPVCSPSRGSFFTGRYTHRHGMLANAGQYGVARFDDRDTFATRLSAAGYRTGFLGKYANGFSALSSPGMAPPPVPPGWDDFRVFDHAQGVPQHGFAMVENGERRDYSASDVYATDLLSDRAIEFIDGARAADPARPFALWISTSTPHYPWEPAPRHRGAFAGLAWPTAPNVYELDVSDKPPIIQRLPIPTLLEVLQGLRKSQRQLEMQLSTDELVARLIDHLDALGVGDDTVVVYTSDNGEAWGEHRWRTKGCPWDACLRVPMLVRYPRVVPGPRSVEGLVSSLDVLPTLLGLVGPVPDGSFDGDDLGDVLRGGAVDPDRTVLIESFSAGEMSFAGIRSRTSKYVLFESGEEALYDLERDPWELDDWKASPEHASVLAAMRAQLLERWPGWNALPLP